MKFFCLCIYAVRGAVANLLFKRVSGVFAKSYIDALQIHPPGFAFYITLGFNVERP